MENKLEPFKRHGTPEERINVDADEILDAIAEGRDIDVEYAEIDGDLDIGKVAGRLEKDEQGRQIIKGGISIRDSEISGDANFSYASFSENANFREASFSGNAYFEQASFSKYANFGGASFSGDANFKQASFSGYAYFGEASFSRYAEFEKAGFSKYVDFEEAGFSRYANFREASFSGDAYFEQASFSEDADFEFAQFSSDAYFADAVLCGGVSFDGTVLEDRSLPSIYIQYSELLASEVGELLLSIDILWKKMVERAMEERIRLPEKRPRLEICEIHTGDSIEIRFGKGFKPRVYVDEEKNVIVEIPEKLGIIYLVGHILLFSYSTYIDTRLKRQDIHIKERQEEIQKLDIELKKLELELKQRELKIKKSTLHSLAPVIHDQAIVEGSDQIIRTIVENPRFVHVKLDGVTIKR